ncbi:hypothetical protein [Paenibacillus chitinolyticus]|uniref:hypothetical protein n=1 Tax=Paenibacillus chitinolyticus TaxID=79263 RepID=UPI00366EDC65
MSDKITILKNEAGRIITAELSYLPPTFSNSPFGNLPNRKHKYNSAVVQELLRNHVTNSTKLREMSDYLYGLNGIYRRLIDTSKNIISFEYTISPLIKNVEKLNVGTFENKYFKVREYLWDCNLDTTLDDMFFKLLKYGRYSAYDRDSYLQPLPLDYTRIIGVASDGNPIIQFNFEYFDQFPTMREKEFQLNGYDGEFKRLYIRYKQRIDNKNENFANEYQWRTLPHTKTYTLKIGTNLESSEGLGLLYGSVDDIIFYEEMRELDRDIIGSQKRKIIVQQIPVDKEGHSILGEEEIIQMHENLKKLLPANVGCLTVLGGTKYSDIPLQLSAIEKGKMQEVQSDVLMGSGIGEGALKGGNFSTGVLNIDVLTNTLTRILKQIETVWLNRKLKQINGSSQLSFKVKFLGITPFNREKIIDMFDGLLDKGGSLNASVAARGFDVFEYVEMLHIEDRFDLKSKFEPLKTSFTLSKKDGGRQKGTGEGGDNADKASNSGSNELPSPSD